MGLLFDFHPLAMRAFSFVTQMASAVYLAWGVTVYARRRCGLEVWLVPVVAGALAGASQYVSGLCLTFDYYSLSSAAAAAHAGAVLRALSEDSLKRRLPWLVLAATFVSLVAMARLPAGVVHAGLLLAAVLLLDPVRPLRRITFVAYGVLSAVMFAVLITVLGSWPVFIDAVIVTLTHSRNVGFAYHAAAQGVGILYLFGEGIKSTFGPLNLLSIVLSVILLSRKTTDRRTGQMVVGLALLTALEAFGTIAYIARFHASSPIQNFWVLVLVAAALLTSMYRRTFANRGEPPFGPVGILAGWLAATTLMGQFGSGTSVLYTAFSSSAAVFAIIGLVVAVVLRLPVTPASRAVLLACVLALFTTTAQLAFSIRWPFLVDMVTARSYQPVAGVPEFRGLMAEPAQVAYYQALRQEGTRLSAEAPTKVMGYADRMGPDMLTGLPIHGDIVLSDLFEDLGCFMVSRAHRAENERILLILWKDKISDQFATCLRRNGIDFPANFKKIRDLSTPPMDGDGFDSLYIEGDNRKASN